MKYLVIDIGGTSVKLWAANRKARWKIPSGPGFTPQQLVEEVHRLVDPADYDAVSIGYPGKLSRGKPVQEPYNLAGGWVDFDYAAHFDRPLRMMNDAAMQALGSYKGGRMLFLGLGTSVGSALIVDNVVVPLELGNIPHAFGETLEDLLARKALQKLGKRRWRFAVLDALPRLQGAFMADYLVLGGGNAKKLKRRLPDGVRLGSNRQAYRGGCRLWECKDPGSVQFFEGRNEPPKPTNRWDATG